MLGSGDGYFVGYSRLVVIGVSLLGFFVGFWLCFGIDSFAQCRRPHFFALIFSLLRQWDLAFKKIVLRGFVGKLQGFFMRGRVVQKC